MRFSNLSIFFHLFCTALAKTNILLIMSDDLGQVISPYVPTDHPLASRDLAPKFHDFLASATAFNGITSFPVCGPSRASSLTGRQPDRLNIYNFERYIDQSAPGINTIFGYFKQQHNYETFIAGKVFHQDANNGEQLAHLTGQISKPAIMIHKANAECGANKMWCSINPQDSADEKVVSAAEKFFAKMRKTPSKAWVAGIGLHRPHIQTSYLKHLRHGVSGDLPNYNVPQISETKDFRHSLAYRDDTETAEQFKVKFNTKWQTIINRSSRPTSYDLYNGKYDATVKRMRAAYYTGSRYVMINIGKIIDALTANGFANNTHIVFYSDHGWQNGERRMLGKNGLGRAATDIPLIIHMAGQAAGFYNRNPVSPLDIFPTLIELAIGPTALRSYTDPSKYPLDGKSLVAAISNPNLAINDFVVSQYPRCQPIGSVQTDDCMTAANNNAISCLNNVGRPKVRFMGYLSVYANGDRYVEWREFNEQITTCARATWQGMPSKINSWGPHVWQINPAHTCTNWQKTSLQPELYAAGDEFGTNLAFTPKPAQAKLINQYSKNLQAKLGPLACRL